MSRTAAAKSEVTRSRILEVACALFRERGIDQVGVRDIMEHAGLTRGGFYFHFADKDALVREAMQQAALESAEEYVRCAEQASAGHALHALIESYLSAAHRDHPESGCVVASLASEAGRGDRQQRHAFNAAVSTALAGIAPYVPGETPEQRGLRAGLLLSSMAGVLMVSRALDHKRSEALLEGARAFFLQNFGGR